MVILLLSHPILHQSSTVVRVHGRVLVARRRAVRVDSSTIGPAAAQEVRTVVVHGEEFDAPPRVVLPEKHRLVIDELAALCVDDLSPKVLVLEEIQEVQTSGVFDEARVFWLLPVEQVL